MYGSAHISCPYHHQKIDPRHQCHDQDNVSFAQNGLTREHTFVSDTGGAVSSVQHTNAELLHAQQMLMDVGIKVETPKPYTDATVAKSPAARQPLSRIRHLEVRCLRVQDLTEQKKLTALKVAGTSNPADMGTKHVA
eukprot:2664256-Amphidinium_carterae.1